MLDLNDKTVSVHAQTALEALDKLIASPLIIPSADMISQTIEKIEAQLRDRLSFYNDNTFRYYIDDLDTPLAKDITNDYQKMLSWGGVADFIRYFPQRSTDIVLADHKWANSIGEIISTHSGNRKIYHPISFSRSYLSYGQIQDSDKSSNLCKKARIYITEEQMYGFISHFPGGIYQADGYDLEVTNGEIDPYSIGERYNAFFKCYLLVKSASTKPLYETKLKPTRVAGFKHLTPFLEELRSYCEQQKSTPLNNDGDCFYNLWDKAEMVSSSFAKPEDFERFTATNLGCTSMLDYLNNKIIQMTILSKHSIHI